jgi:hypothetical protein
VRRQFIVNSFGRANVAEQFDDPLRHFRRRRRTARGGFADVADVFDDGGSDYFLAVFFIDTNEFT